MKWGFYVAFLTLLMIPSHVWGEPAGHEGEHHDEHEEAEPNLAISEDLFDRFGLRLETAAPASIAQGFRASGRIVPVDSKLAHVSPRFPGVVKEVFAKVGDQVKPSMALATVQNNQNLQTFTLAPSISGMVIKRHATLGEVVNESSVLFVIADISELWCELAIYKKDVGLVHAGQKVILSSTANDEGLEGEIVFFSPLTDEQTQSRAARVLLKNPRSSFSPGTFVDGIVVIKEVPAAVAVDISALQNVDGSSVVFVRVGDNFEPRKVRLGEQDERNVAVLSGLRAGDKYAAGKTFVLKAELEKAEASHEH